MSAVEVPLEIIRTSDRGQFKRCRTLWDMTSKMRLNYQYAPGVEPLDFGTAVHAGAEAYYDPITWHDDAVKQALAIAAFKDSMLSWKKRIKDSGMWDNMQETFETHWELGLAMLDHYFLWAPDADKNFVPVKVEIEFEVPIPCTEALLYKMDLGGHWQSINDQLYYRGRAVVYQGRIDLIFQDKRDGTLWILDHKTAAQFGQTEHLELDQQCGSYVWACQKMLGLDVAGVIYSEWRKKAPKDPDILKSGLPSQNKAQSTTPELYRQKLRELGLPEEDYTDFLQSLQESGQQYFRRIQIYRSVDELAHLESNIVNEAVDMIDNPRIYPNPSRWNCNGCQFRSPCLMRQEGGDWKWFLQNSQLYEQRR